MKYITKPLLEMEAYNEILKSVSDYTLPVVITGPSESQKVHMTYSLGNHLKTRIVYIAHNEIQARKVYEDFSFFLGKKALFYPSRELILHDIEAKSYEDVYERINVLQRVINGQYDVLVTSVKALLHRLINKNHFKSSIIKLDIGKKVNIEKISQKLAETGYERVGSVEVRGQFAVRGGIVDIYSPQMEYAVRIELFDDEIDSIRSFDVISQRSVQNCTDTVIIPAREIIYRREEEKRIKKSILKEFNNYVGQIENNDEVKGDLRKRIEEDLEELRNNHYFPGMDRYIMHIAQDSSNLLDYAGNESLVVIDESVRMEKKVKNAVMEHHETCKMLLQKGSILPSAFDIYYKVDEINKKLSCFKTVGLSSMPVSYGYFKNFKKFSILSKSLSTYRGHLSLLIEDVKQWKERNYRIIILSGTNVRGSKLADRLRDNNIEAVFYRNFNDIKTLEKGSVIVAGGSLNKGFEYPGLRLVVVSDKEVFGRKKRAVKRFGKNRGDRIKSFTDLNYGDFVVHQTHGIGKYMGIEQLVIENTKKDYLKIKYQQGDFLYIPTSQLDLIHKFIGYDRKNPRLSKLGGNEWKRAKRKVRESLKEIAGELIELYAQRQSTKGFAFSKDTVWQKQFEDLFPYEETNDQIKCINEVKQDMESNKLMDRLLCGDVGYGKTEVAVRAAFKAVMDGKQVAYLVPTTVLAQQHYTNFKERLKDFPVTVDVISRFRTRNEQKKILKHIKTGLTDILIGTHRLIQKDIHFKDLGLLVIDEEQRFGVRHKEKLKSFKPNVDVLTLTATPIPRTLHMSLAGIRDISTLEDPPEERYPVQTYVMEYNMDIICDAIERELGREGQVFYLFNRVRSINLTATRLKKLVPDAKIAIAHGQMNERELEEIMFDFINKEYDILVCTTIIESGLDMPNVNTIIVENSDKMGLAQLYQLRGRVGRSNRLAYAYITYKKNKMLTEIAEKRLQAIKEFTEFGSGFRIAMRDLEIRGAGNILGPEQHGHIASVGYDMYCRLLNQAVKEIKGEVPVEEDKEILIDLNVDAYIDDRYIEDKVQKIDMYRRIASIQDNEDVVDVQDELTDRYGEIPLPVMNLIQTVHIKSLAADLKIVSIKQKGSIVNIEFDNNKDLNVEAVSNLIDKYGRKLLFNAGNNPYIAYKITGGDKKNILENIKILLHDAKSFAV